MVSRHSQELPAILDDAALSVSDRSAHLNALKMNCYALICLLESFETMSSQTGLMDLELGGKVIWCSWLLIRGLGRWGSWWERWKSVILRILSLSALGPCLKFMRRYSEVSQCIFC